MEDELTIDTPKGDMMGWPGALVMCPTQLVQGRQVTVDPLGHPAEPTMGRASRWKVGKSKMVNGQKVCPFSCPDFFVE
ncbi:hypothetical protein ABIA85_009898 [Bradyrhizobium sp. LA6.10]|uniref:hypothetical protein n=1 Tax=Bradyrhizobium sp. LA6.10 TaxID=3156318 RepID=UPI003391A60D